MRSSELTERVEVVRLSWAPDGAGGQAMARETVAVAMAKVTNLTGREFWEAFAVSHEASVVARMRWCEAIASADTRGCVLVIRGRDYDITSLDNVGWANRDIMIRAKARA